MRVLFSLLAAFMLAQTALAQTAPVELDERSSEQLGRGERTRVIVQFELRELAFDGLQREDRDAARRDAIHTTTDAILQRAFRSGLATMSANQAETRGPRLARSFDYTPAFAIYVNRAELDALAADPSVSRIVTDGLERPMLGNAANLIQANTIHDIGYRGNGTIIAVLDTGIFYDHPAFEDQIRHSACFSTHDPGIGAYSLCINDATSDGTNPQAAAACTNSTVAEECMHGTLVASIAAGRANPDSDLGAWQLNGIAPEARLIPVQVFTRFSNREICGAASYCLQSYISDQLNALEWLYANWQPLGLAAVNMSLGGSPHIGACSSDIRAGIIAELRESGVATIVASGNEGSGVGVSPPGCIPEAIAVAGSHGFSLQGNIGSLVDVAAPWSVTAAGLPVSGQLHEQASGTSIATPHVSGAFALLREAFPSASVDEIEQALEDTGVPATHSFSGVEHPFIQLFPAYNALRPDTIEVERTGGTHFVRQYNVEDTGQTVSYRFTNTGNETETWRLNTNIHSDTRIDLTGGNATHLSPFQHDYAGALAPSESLIVTLRFPEGFNLRDQTLEFIGGGIYLSQTLTFEITYPTATNDHLANALHVQGHPLRNFVYSFGTAGYDGGETAEDGYTGSVWFTWRPGVDRTILARSANPISLYTGSIDDASTLTPIGREYSDDQGFNVEFDALRGTTYIVRILVTAADTDLVSAGFSSHDPERLLGEGPWDAIELPNGSGFVMDGFFDLRNHRVEDGEMFALEGDEYRQWFVWTAPYSGRFVMGDQALANDIPDDLSSLSIYRRTDGASQHMESDDPALLEAVGTAILPRGSTDPAARVLEVDVEAGRTYWIRTGTWGQNGPFFTYGQAAQLEARLRGAVLPNRRTMRLGNTATAFLTLINPASQDTTARNCRIIPVDFTRDPRPVPARFELFMTNEANQIVGEAVDTFDLLPGTVQNFVFALDAPTASSWQVVMVPVCDNVLPQIGEYTQVSNFGFAVADRPMSDVISIAVTSSGDGILELPNGVVRAFSVAATNIGDDTTIMRVYPSSSLEGYRGDNGEISTVEICETIPETGQCFYPRADSVIVTFAPGEVKTFSIFARAYDYPERFSPNNFRVVTVFEPVYNDGLRGARRSETSVALRTLGD